MSGIQRRHEEGEGEREGRGGSSWWMRSILSPSISQLINLDSF